jgi:phenylacetate-CoA ligase
MSNQLPAGYLNTDELLQKLQTASQKTWTDDGFSRALKLFHSMAERVPAYKDFLSKEKIDHELIKTKSDFQQIPTVDKNSYLRQYPLDALSWDGKLSEKALTVSSTSGSTGEPFYFPREHWQDLQYAIMAELYLKTNFQLDKKRTLYIIGFPMGQWIGGIFTFEAMQLVAQRTKYPLSTIAPGVNADEILKALTKLGPYFDQVLIGSYGPFLKDTIDEAALRGLDWKKYNLGFIFAAEVFSESFRDYVASQTGLPDVYRGTLNQYGTVDLGTMAYETPIAIAARRIANDHKALFNTVFNRIHRVPTLTQYFPELFYFESVNENLFCSAYSGLPLTRYDLKDRGRVLDFNELVSIYQDHSVDLLEEVRKLGLSDTVWKLPFVYVYERSDFSVSFYAFNIYPETIRRALLDDEAQQFCTGKFTMFVNTNSRHDQRLNIHIELKSNVEASTQIRKRLTFLLRNRLLEENSAYRRTHEVKGRKVDPKITLWQHGSPRYFNPVIKQRWVKKD